MQNHPKHQPHHNNLAVPMTAQQTPDMAALSSWMQDIHAAVGHFAVLQERHAQNERRFTESETRTADTLNKIDQSIARVHERLDAMNSAMREEVSSVREEVRQFNDMHRQETGNQIAKAIEPVWGKLDACAAQGKETKTELDGWINRVRGGWFIGSICAGIFQSCMVAALVWVANEVKTTHDWRIQMEAAQRVVDARAERASGK